MAQKTELASARTQWVCPDLRTRAVRFLIAIVIIPILVPIASIIYIKWVPAHSATLEIRELNAQLTLRFYYLWGPELTAPDHGRYLTVRSPAGSKTIAMNAFDWAHNSRTSVYRTPNGEIAILGPIEDDYFVTLSPLKVVERFGPLSERWTYLGAFDYELLQHDRKLRFVRADEQAECIPMRGGDTMEWQPRKTARQRNCAHYSADEKSTTRKRPEF